MRMTANGMGEHPEGRNIVPQFGIVTMRMPSAPISVQREKMPMFKGTAGPWRFLEEGDTESEYNIGKPLTICGGNDDDLIDVFDNTNSTVSISRGEAIANARLVAAAPDLLAALKAAIEPTVDDEVDAAERDAIYEQCVAAIKKAEGQS